MAGTSISAFLEPERIVRYFDLKPGDHVADFGAGHGFFTIPMARAVGGDGKVYAVDVQKSVLDIIRARAKLENLLNIEPIWADLDEPRGSKLKDKFLDLVVIANILFQAEKKDAIFREAHRILREGGRLAVVEWDETPTPMGPPLTLRVKKDAAKSWAVGVGFELEKEFEAGSHHYGLLFHKP
ncbi:MAG: methyltransferase domain-containing protein [Candidatus Sungbacteria bacterium]|nr:methyltransferase domain-containing protein [Candidatus Sungbacteria bacterium]